MKSLLILCCASILASCNNYASKPGTPSDTSMKPADTIGGKMIPTPPANKDNGRPDPVNHDDDSTNTPVKDSARH